MTPDEAIAKWRTLTEDQFIVEIQNAEFRDAYEEAGRLALASGDPRRRFWEIDAAGWRKNQFNVNIPPARPNERDPYGPGSHR